MSEENQDKAQEVDSNETKPADAEKNTKWYVLREVSGKKYGGGSDSLKQKSSSSQDKKVRKDGDFLVNLLKFK